MKWTRQQYIDYLTFGDFKRPMFVELFGPLVGLDNEWRAQGAPEDKIGMVGFDWDYVPYVSCGGNTDIFGGPKSGIIEETAEYIIESDQLGRRMKLMKGKATVPLPMDYPVRNMEDWLKYKPLYLFDERRIDWTQVEKAVHEQKNGSLVLASIPGGFDLPRQLMGEEELCYAYYEQPELIKDILDTAAETAISVLERITEKVTIDQLSVHEDMAGKSGPLIGPGQIEEFIKPYYLKVWNMLSSQGTRIFSQDSDGNMDPVIDVFLESGLTEMYPMEPGAGMDIVKVREKYGNRLSLKGGINKYVLRDSKEAIRRELEYKMQDSMQRGGVVFGLDHRIPNGTPFEYYEYYVELGRELLGIEPLTDDMKGWMRQAF
ncbi:MAG TPA: uroporphyrinogen decarboxylase family protein [Clostridia bacterium]|nr:uroporphyrinogen decarboxylase family protein [Clostridia bacterium]